MKYTGIFFSKIIPAFYSLFSSVLILAQALSSDSYCLECHSDATRMKELSSQFNRFLIHPEFNEQSVHNEISCTGCHADPGGYPHPEVVGLIQCGTCHEGESNEYLSGPHGNPLTVSMELAPKCWDCHNLHLIRKSSDKLSNIHKANEASTCTKCHGNEEYEKRLVNLSDPAVHKTIGRPIKNGIHAANIKIIESSALLTCSDCHGYHSLSDVIGKEWQDEYISEVDFCAKCHENETNPFEQNLHFKQEISSLNGETRLICSDCHQEHEINSDKYIANEENSAKKITDKCLECHLPVRISGTFAQNVRGFDPSIDSFHGTTNFRGKLVFNNCSSCHGIHELKTYRGISKSDIQITLIAECGNCHPNAAANFVSSPVHMAQGKEIENEETIARYVFTTLIVTMLSLFILSVVRDYYKLYLRRKN